MGENKEKMNMLPDNTELENYEDLAKSLDELSARFIRETGNLPSNTTIIELMNWVCKQIQTEQ